MRYQDFKIRIEGKRGEGYDVSVESPAGNSEENIVFDFDIPAMAGQMHSLGSTVRGATRDSTLEVPDGPSPAEFGEQLFRTLFTGSIAKMYYQSYTKLSDPNVGLRIKLHLNLNDTDVIPLASVPWEYLREAANMEYLNLSRQTPLVRFLDVQRPNDVQPLDGDLRILVVISDPKGVHKLDLGAERALIENSWAQERGVAVDFLDDATADGLRSALASRAYHVLHYMGHGVHDERTGSGALVLEDQNGDAALLNAEALGQLLRNSPTLRLVFLNACDTAKTDTSRPFAGVTNRLVMAGVPAVVAMQFPISDSAAITFAKAFYSSLVAGAPVDEATAHGRLSIMVNEPQSLEWGTPVLSMRAPDGRLFDRVGAQKNDAQSAAVPPVAAPPKAAKQDVASPKRGIGSVLGFVAMGAAAVIGVGLYLVFFESEPGKVVWDAPSSNLEVGVPTSVRLKVEMPASVGDGEPIYKKSSKHFTVEVNTDSAAIASLVRSGPDSWEWMVTPRAPTEDQPAVLRADVVLLGNGDDDGPQFIEPLNLNVVVNEILEQSYRQATEGIRSRLVSTAEVIKKMGELQSNSARLSPTMNDTLQASMNALNDLATKEALINAPSFSDNTLTDRIVKLDAWKGKFQEVRYALTEEQSHPLNDQLTALRGRTNIEKLVLCSRVSTCGDGSDRFRVNTPLYVVSLPLVSGLDCRIVGPQNKECAVGAGSYRQLNVAGEYTVRVSNADGDLLAESPFTVY
ncbi:MAG: CHAT domain-containing protein [Gammaproteobacteria bacterium]